MWLSLMKAMTLRSRASSTAAIASLRMRIWTVWRVWSTMSDSPFSASLRSPFVSVSPITTRTLSSPIVVRARVGPRPV
jgi:hypothetical protein